jgi:ATP-independent RNA helicase DbpA
VGTPGRVEDHLRKKTLDLESCNTLVLDEADRMLDMGFQDTLEKIIKYVPEERQTLLFSATFPNQIKSISKKIMTTPVMVKVDTEHQESTIEQHFYRVGNSEQRLLGLRLLLLKHNPESALVFCNTKVETQNVNNELRSHGFSSVVLNGDLEQRDRDQMLVCFANKTASILVATDVAARGLDIADLDLVINYELAFDPEIHVHRVGRTGRAGNTGMACTLYSERDDYRMAVLKDYLNLEDMIQPELLPSESLLDQPVKISSMQTIRIDGGKKQKIRAGDILGALTGQNGIDGKEVGKINLADNWSYVAVTRDSVDKALRKLKDGKLKGRKFRAWIVKA